MPKSTLTDISLILDRSGSMEDCWNDTIEAFNRFVSEQQQEPGDCYFTLLQFDHCYDIIHSGVPIKDVSLLTKETYKPRGSTALLDAIGRTVATTGNRLAAMEEHERPGNVLMVVLTDGQENASVEFSLSQIKETIKHQTDKYNWHFVFLGADQDAIVAGTSMGILPSSSLSYGKLGPKGPNGPSGTKCAVAAMNAAVKNYRSTSGESSCNFFVGTESLQAGDDLDNQVVKLADKKETTT